MALWLLGMVCVRFLLHGNTFTLAFILLVAGKGLGLHDVGQGRLPPSPGMSAAQEK